ncbi:MAG: DUF5655 domain-containing protein [Filomicrobium sp.]
MSRDYAEKELEFITSLKADSGRDLAEWMATIDAQAFAHRNDTIDWLRQQGFLFAWASWLERIHNNGGQPIYCELDAVAANDATAATKATPAAEEPTPRSERVTSPRVEAAREEAASIDSPAIVLERPAPPIARPKPALRLVHSSEPSPTPAPVKSEPAAKPSPTPAATPLGAQPTAAKPAASSTKSTLSPDVMAVTASAKAYAPLAGFIVRRILETAPDCEVTPSGKQITFHSGALPFALLFVSSKDLRLCFAGPDSEWLAPVEKVRLPKSASSLSPSLTHMLVLTDARQIDERFDNLIGQAHRRVPA